MRMTYLRHLPLPAIRRRYRRNKWIALIIALAIAALNSIRRFRPSHGNDFAPCDCFIQRLAPRVQLKRTDGDDWQSASGFRHKLIRAATAGQLWNSSTFDDASGRYLWNRRMGREMLSSVTNQASSADDNSASGLRCFTHTSDRENAQYFKPVLLRSCYASTLCYDPARETFIVPLRDHAGREKWRVDYSAFAKAKFSATVDDSDESDAVLASIKILDMLVEVVDKPPPFSFTEYGTGADASIFDQRLHPDNPYHNLVEHYANTVEAVLASLQQRNEDPDRASSTSSKRPSSVLPGLRLYTTSVYSMHAPKLLFDDVLRPLFSAQQSHTILDTVKSRESIKQWELPLATALRPSSTVPPFCTNHVWIGLPSAIRMDGRYEFRYPSKKTPPAIARMIWSREVVASLSLAAYEHGVNDIIGGGPIRAVNVIDYHKMESRMAAEDELNNSDCASFACRLFARALRLAELERSILWPAITPRWPHGTVIVVVVREGSRSIINAADLYLHLHNEFSIARGYTLVFAKMEKLSAVQQILLASRATVMIGSHGAGLVHSMWMQPGGGASLLELRSPQNRRKWFAMVAQDHMLDYYVNQAVEPRSDWELSDDPVVDGCAGSIGLVEGVCSDAPPGWKRFSEFMGDEPFSVNIQEVLAMVRLAVYRSDRRFGIPKECHKPVGAEDVRIANYWLCKVQ